MTPSAMAPTVRRLAALVWLLLVPLPARADLVVPDLGAAAGALGPLVESAVRIGDRLCLGVYAGYCSYKALRVERRFQRGEIGHEARVDAHYKNGLGFTGSLAGGALGGAAGAFVGAPLGPPGMLVGGLVGGFGGGVAGERVGSRHGNGFRELMRRGASAAGAAAERLGEKALFGAAAVVESRPVQAACRFGKRVTEKVGRVWK